MVRKYDWSPLCELAGDLLLMNRLSMLSVGIDIWSLQAEIGEFGGKGEEGTHATTTFIAYRI